MSKLDPRYLIAAGGFLAIAGFLMMEDYDPRFFIGNIMQQNIDLVHVPYRYVLLFSFLLIVFGAYRLLAPKQD
jgi:hypothetical protein